MDRRRLARVIAGLALLAAAATAVGEPSAWAGGRDDGAQVTPRGGAGTDRSERAIVVFGAPVAPNGRVTGALERRLQTALRIAERQPRAAIVVTGGAVANPFAEGPAMRDWLVKRGVAPARIYVEDRARFTRENATRVAPIVQKLGATQVTVVTERYHLRRSVADMKLALADAAAGRRVSVSAAAAPDRLTAAERARVKQAESQKLARDRAELRR